MTRGVVYTVSVCISTSQPVCVYITICVIFVSNPLSYAVTWQRTSKLLIQVRQYSEGKKAKEQDGEGTGAISEVHGR